MRGGSTGLGIGLHLVKRLVEMHGGTVTARSEGSERGSEFVVRLPVLADVPERQFQPESKTAPVQLGVRRILVVDDNQDAATSLATLLESSGCDTAIAYDGIQALERASAYEPDAIVLDIGLPGMSGYDVCRALRHRPNGQNPIMIAFTGWGQDEDRRKSAAAGFDGHLVKPVRLAELNELLTTLCSKTAERRIGGSAEPSRSD